MAERAKLQGYGPLDCRALQSAINYQVRRPAMARTSFMGHKGVATGYQFGVLGALSLSVPIVVHDHPELSREFPHAFTTGTHVLMSAGYAAETLALDEKSGGREQNGLFSYLHELSHIAYGHTRGRLEHAAPRRDRNIVFDALINPRQLRAFSNVVPSATAHRWIATSEQAIRRFALMTEEEAMAWYLRDPVEFCRAADCPELARAPDTHGSHISTPTEMLDWANTHQALALCEELGLGDNLKAEQLQQSAEQAERYIDRAVEEALQTGLREATEIDQVGASSPADHVLEMMSEAVRLKTNAQVSMGLRLRRIYRDLAQPRVRQTDDIPNEIRYTPAAATGFNVSPYLPGQAAVTGQEAWIRVIIDTSCSVPRAEIEEAFAHILSFGASAGRSRLRFYVSWGDTHLRGKPLTVTAGDEGRWADRDINALGRTGTDLENCLVEALRPVPGRAGPWAGVLYFTDLEAAPPRREALPRRIPPVTFLCRPDKQSPAFRRAVSPWGHVVAREAGSRVTL